MKRYISIVIICMLLFSCSNLVDDLNNDPNNLTKSGYGTVLTGAEVGNLLFQSGESARRAAIFAGQYKGIDRQHEGFYQYSVTTSDFDALWNDAFVNAFRNALIAEETALNDEIGPIAQGIALVLQAHSMGSITALYGDIPFDEAGNVAIADPAFEGQLSVYGKIQNTLDTAISLLNQGTGRPSAGSDIYFDGDANAWVETAYTLKARFYMHTKNYQDAWNAALNGISSLENSMYGPHGTAMENSNLNYQFFAVEVRQADVVVSDFMASLVNPETSNPIPSNYRGNAKTDETGRYNFLFTTNSTGIQPNTTTGFAAQDAPAPLVTYEENLLILAEAGLRSNGFDEGLSRLNDYRSFMDNGGYLRNVDPSQVTYEPYVAADFESGGMENTNGISTENALLREILEERYVTFFGLLESFNDTRRTERETTVRVPIVPNAGNDLPQRFLYPQSEIDRNSNVPSPIPNFFEETPVNQ
ncbi:SusD/RagB family nutrient-binding outer membrane lipoprotein [Flagellimonas profundi]|uniref:SusD/RagB family nutrient-binding outer membrane lipoprotein n=1 Tax=Flagellimonas profundi TaxID=2915620 RepID=A0ABS3FJU2_9FLAO|nr:SusD/RagB family nutrient-binding outer membrane lipoprotein [Allomuricauda profundi]MBO0343472.1 SusD/RagB family nutrient-binding outer membrane lipoprotein [Allomuricauda profundi]